MALSEVPFRVPLLEGERQRSFLSRFWSRYFQSIVDIVNNVSRQLALVSKTAQVASISATSVQSGLLDPGVYRVSYSARVTTAATTSSSLTVTITWTDGNVTQTHTGSAITGNTTATQQNATLLIHNGANTLAANNVVKYATTYASSGGTAMVYALYVLVEKIA